MSWANTVNADGENTEESWPWKAYGSDRCEGNSKGHKEQSMNVSSIHVIESLS